MYSAGDRPARPRVRSPVVRMALGEAREGGADFTFSTGVHDPNYQPGSQFCAFICVSWRAKSPLPQVSRDLNASKIRALTVLYERAFTDTAREISARVGHNSLRGSSHWALLALRRAKQDILASDRRSK